MSTETDAGINAEINYETLEVRHDAGVDYLTLNRPEALNSLNTQMVTDLRHYFSSLMENATTRVVVMRGAGRAFCAGLDIKSAGGADSSGHKPVGQGWGFQGYLAEVYILMRRCPQPIISLVQGPACGGGFAFVLASDIRIAADNARMNAAFIRIGLSACDMGTSYFLPRLVGTSLASELMLTGRFIHADRALATGLVSQVVPADQLDEAAKPYLREMLTTSPMGLRLTKEGLNMAIDANSLESAMAIENRNQILCSGTDDAKEGMRAFLEKRDPVYTGR
ncbi:MAG: enoyl-CoA hydratase/carnithine racemase [Candidatus Azotimanducaceae bacterium]|jgi:enoyl-CoA hydratase/carnithine racemase